MIFTIISIVVALFFAMNMGASGAAASMGVAYGSGAIRKKQMALTICAFGVFLGAIIGGGEVVKTIGSGIIPSSVISVKIALIILISATFTLFIANIMGIPLSTSEVTVGAIVGVGMAFQSVYIHKLLIVISFWIIIPFIAFSLTFCGGIFLLKWKRMQNVKHARWGKSLQSLVIITGFMEAFSAGMNNVSNAVGPLVGAGLITVSTGTMVGGAFIALGAIFLGGRVIETNGKKITNLSLVQGSTVSGLSASLVIICSLFGMPVPITQITTAGILGIGVAEQGVHLWQKDIIKRMLKVWVVSPIISLVIAYGTVKLFFESDFYTLVAIACVFFATIGTMSLLKSAKKEQKPAYNTPEKKQPVNSYLMK